MPSNNIVNVKGAKTVSPRTTGVKNQRVTVMLGVMVDGTKLPPFIIFKLANGNVFQRKTYPQDCLIDVRKSGGWQQNLWVIGSIPSRICKLELPCKNVYNHERIQGTFIWICKK